MSEQNKIILELVEKEETKLSGKGIQENITITGDFSVINPSKSSRIWNAVRSLKGIETTNLGDVEEKVGELKPESKNTVSYQIQEQDVSYKP